ncbi:MAG TPA: phosphatase PAP2 family protein [Actinomycetes bacterium]|nr:phosphatase PAP2 family protein [Actinomycetes bacterium]
MTPDPSDDLFSRINDFARATPWLHWPVTEWAKYGIVVFAALLVVGWWIARSRDARTMAAALIAPISTVVAVAVNQPIIKAFDHPRPYVLHPAALVLVTKSADPSFPSDHATMAGAVAAGLLLVSWRLGLVAVACAFVMACARVYVGAHYPVDVVAGLALGALVALGCWLLLRVPVTRLVESLRAGRLGPLVSDAAV